MPASRGYTVGQGKRLGPAAMDGGERQVVRGARSGAPAHRGRPAGCRHRPLRLREVNWLAPTPRSRLRCQVKLRARDAPQRGDGDASTAEGAEVRLDAPALPAPGQACVFYEGERVLGGGFIRPAGMAVDGAGVAAISRRLADRMAA